jgi:hypothetical protein
MDMDSGMFREYTPRPCWVEPDPNPNKTAGKQEGTGNTKGQEIGETLFSSCFSVISCFPAEILPVFWWSFATTHRMLARMITNSPPMLSCWSWPLLLGSIPTGAHRRLKGIDLQKVGSGNRGDERIPLRRQGLGIAALSSTREGIRAGVLLPRLLESARRGWASPRRRGRRRPQLAVWLKFKGGKASAQRGHAAGHRAGGGRRRLRGLRPDRRAHALRFAGSILAAIAVPAAYLGMNGAENGCSPARW